MKKLALLFVSLFVLGVSLYAGELETSSKLTAVTVYRNMARETRASTANLPAGNTEVVISGVTMSMLDQSIQVAVKGDAVLLSASVRTNYFQDLESVTTDPRIVKIQDSIKAMNLELRWIAEERSVHVGEIDLVSTLVKSGTDHKDFKPADLAACAELFRTRTMELRKKLFDLQLRQEKLEESLTRHAGQLSEMGPKPKSPLKEIVLNFWSDAANTVQIKTMYLVSAAGWVPMYDLNVESSSKPVDMTYKANIFQSTGFAWKDVNLTVSTSNPGLNNDRPILSPRIVDYINYELIYQNIGSTATNSMYIANRTDDQAESANVPQLSTVPGEAEIHVDYPIEIRQDIPSDGNQHICKLQNYSVPATFRYHAVPKIDCGAYLIARITDYGQYNLLAGKANVFFEDTYIGQVNLNPQVTGDTLLVSLGRDERIVVKRTRIQEKTAKKVLSGAQKENFAYEITVRNNKGTPIDIEILDQVPLSRRKEIIVDLVQKSGADFDVNSGRLLWQMKLDPSKSKTLNLVYTIESPEGKTVGEQ